MSEKRELTKAQLVQRSISKKYRSQLWVPFIQALKTYELLAPGDRVAVCISGGKDSMLLAVMMQMLQKYSDFPFFLRFMVMDPGYQPENRRRIEENLSLLEIPAEIFETNIFHVVEKAEKSPCYLCARMRRGFLYAKAKELGCNKIALGHHLSDAIETTLMGMLFSGKIEGMRPKLHSKNFAGMELIRPLYGVNEGDILAWMRYNELRFIRCACSLTAATEETGEENSASRRAQVKALIRTLKKSDPDVEKSLFKSLHQVNVDTLMGYRYLGEEKSFTQDYAALDNADVGEEEQDSV